MEVRQMYRVPLSESGVVAEGPLLPTGAIGM